MNHLHTLSKILLTDFAQDNTQHNTGDRITGSSQQKAHNSGTKHYYHIKYQTTSDI